MKKFSKMIRVVCVALCAMMLMAGASVMAQDAEKIVVEGSTTVEPIITAFAEYFMKQNDGLNVTVSASGSSTGAKALAAGTCDVAMMSRFMKEKEYKACIEKGIMPVAHVVGMDGLAIAVHPSNPVKDLTMEQVKDIYLGKINNWKEVGGPDKAIVRIGRDTSSGTFGSFSELVMDKEKMSDKIEALGSNGAVQKAVSTTAEAIGYVGLGFLEGVKPVSINGKKPTPQAVASGNYPIARPLFVFTNGYPKLGSKLHAFVSLYLTENGQEMVEEQAYVPVTSY